jgi:hypothetical protein
MDETINKIYSYKLPKNTVSWINKNLLPVLEKTTIKTNANRANSGHGRSQSFGYGNRRYKSYGSLKNNEKYPELYKLLIELGRRIVPEEIPFTTIIVNHNYETKPHIDKYNFGYSLSVSFGDFTGGELVINGEAYQTKYTPLLFNGALNEHYNKPIKGNRYSLVYFVQVPKRIKDDPVALYDLHEEVMKSGV